MDQQRVTVTDIDMPFLSMVRFMVKWALASIPAFILLAVVAWGAVALLAGAIFTGILGGSALRPAATPSAQAEEPDAREAGRAALAARIKASTGIECSVRDVVQVPGPAVVVTCSTGRRFQIGQAGVEQLP